MQGQTNPSILRPKLQRRLRNAPTEAERLLWRHLRVRQLDGCKFRRQHPFGDFILDFACLERMLVIELDGGQHAEQVQADALRTAFLERAGFRVLRFWNHQVFEDMDGVLEAIWQALMERGGSHPNAPRRNHPHPGATRGHHPHPGPIHGNHPHPNPPLEGEGVGKED